MSIVVARSAKPPIFKTEKYRLARASNILSRKEVVRFIILFVAKPKEGKLCEGSFSAYFNLFILYFQLVEDIYSPGLVCDEFIRWLEFLQISGFLLIRCVPCFICCLSCPGTHPPYQHVDCIVV